MITKEQAKIGTRVEFTAMSTGIKYPGTIKAVKGKEIFVAFDDGETGSTFMDSEASSYSVIEK